VEAVAADLREDFRRRALIAGALLFVAAGLTLVASVRGAPMMRTGLLTTGRAIPVHLLTGIFAVAALWALYNRRWKLARFAAAAQASCIVWGWAVAQYPYLLPPNITIITGAAPKVTLELTLGALAVGALVLFPSLAYLFRVFKSDSSRQNSGQ
jgi:cytochrome d ubiquinol oxidase subunit II